MLAPRSGWQAGWQGMGDLVRLHGHVACDHAETHNSAKLAPVKALLLPPPAGAEAESSQPKASEPSESKIFMVAPP